MDNKKLVLGAAGFIGSQLTKALINDGFEVIGIDSFDETLYPSRRRRESVRELQNKGLEFIETDANFVE
jgi:UDP-glucuronate 4-epimerase